MRAYSGVPAFFEELPYLNDALTNYWVLLVVTVICSLLLSVKYIFFALKFKSFGWKGNARRWALILISAVLHTYARTEGFPLLIIVIYLKVMSLIRVNQAGV